MKGEVAPGKPETNLLYYQKGKTTTQFQPFTANVAMWGQFHLHFQKAQN